MELGVFNCKPNKIESHNTEEEINKVIITYSKTAFRLCAFSNMKIIFKVFFILLTAIQYNNWQINCLNNSFPLLFENFWFMATISRRGFDHPIPDLQMRSSQQRLHIWITLAPCRSLHSWSETLISHISIIYSKAWC